MEPFGGVVIGRNEDMFIPKGATVGGVPWNETMFWNVYYVKGAFLDAEKAFEVINGMRTLELRMLQKCIGTRVLAGVLARQRFFFRRQRQVVDQGFGQHAMAECGRIEKGLEA